MRSAAVLCAAVLCAAAAATALATVGIVVRLHVALPYWDEWFTVDHIRRFAQGRYGLPNLAEQHNEHRLLFPRIVFFADALLFRLSGRLDLSVTLLLQLGNAALLIAVMARRVARPAHRALLGGFVVLLLSSLRQEQNFTNGFQLQFVGVFTAGLLAVLAYGAALGRMGAGRPGAVPRFAAAALCCVVSTYTMANGLTAGFVLAVLALLAGARPPVALATAALSGSLALLFFQHYVPGGASLPLSEVPSHLWAYPRFVTAYLGDPIGSSIRSTQALGLLGLILLAGAAWRVARGAERDPSGLVLVGMAGFVLASVAATAYGRVALGTEQAFESRYATPALIFWCAMAIFWWPVAARAAAPALALGAVMALLAGASCWFEATAWPDLAARSAALRRVSDSLLAGLYDGDTAATYETTEDFRIADFVPFLRANGLSAFADPDSAALGRPVGPASPPGACDGTVAAAADPALGSGGVRLSGRATDDTLHRAPRRILLADAAGTVVGFGSASLPGEPSRLWTGYARAATGDVLRAYARLGDGALCDLGSATVGPAADR